MQGFAVVDIGRKQHTLTVRVHSAYEFAVYLNADFSRGFERKHSSLPLSEREYQRLHG
jgi:hypothetical protein